MPDSSGTAGITLPKYLSSLTVMSVSEGLEAKLVLYIIVAIIVLNLHKGKAVSRMRC